MILDPEVAEYAERWKLSHAEEVRAALAEAGVETALPIPEGIRRQSLSAFGFCAGLLIGTELGYRAIWSRARREGFEGLSINAVRSYASRLRAWYGVPLAERRGRSGLRWRK